MLRIGLALGMSLSPDRRRNHLKLRFLRRHLVIMEKKSIGLALVLTEQKRKVKGDVALFPLRKGTLNVQKMNEQRLERVESEFRRSTAIHEGESSST